MAKRTKYATREEWLHAVKDRLAPKFLEVSAPLPSNIRVTCGFPSHGATGRQSFVAGECWPDTASTDKVFEIFISPRLDAFRAGGVLVHELCHAADRCKHAHKAPFAKIAKAMGLVGKITGTKAGPELTKDLERILREVGPYPHAALNVFTEDDKKQTTRLIKASCETCGYTVRVTRKWLEQDGAPICPADDGEHGTMLAEDPEDGGEE